MRLWATLISAQMWVAVASAETLPDKVVSTLKDICVSPTSSEEKMAAGEKNTVKENWKLFRSGPAPMLLQHNENGVKDSFENIWEFDLPEGQRAHLYIAALRPEPPDRKYTVCLIQPAIDMDADDLSRSIDRQFGSTVIKDTSGRFRGQRSWFFTEEKSKGNCGKQIYFSLNQFSNNGQPKTLVFTDFVYPSDKKWDAMANPTRCPNQ
ncbi:MAG TPA: hypothetical protein VGO01_20390 [Bradyrhizobium sp.]|jgi:hypothetical protein|nr:hypothetical protein [Bradyrhizobium sp.]